MKQILWISRHQMTPPQLADLERIMGGPVRLLPWSDTIWDLSALEPALRRVDAVAAVLPVHLLAQLLKLAGGKPVLYAVSARQATGRTVTTPDGQTEREFAFVHQGWQQILRVNIDTKNL